MVGVAFEKHDTYMLQNTTARSDAGDSSKLKLEYKRINPSFTDLMMYSYCYIGLLTGKC